MKRLSTSLLAAIVLIAAGPALAQRGGERMQAAPQDFSALAEARLGGVVTVMRSAEGATTNQTSASGFAVDAEGLVITHAAAVQGVSSVEVILADGTKLNASVAATDEQSGIALLETRSSRDLPVMPWKSAKDLALGSWLVALGRPTPETPTIAVGIASAPVGEFVSSDLAIGPANIGGPVLDAAGRVVGFSTVVRGSGGTPVRAVLPSDRVQKVLTGLTEEVRESRKPARLGVVVQGLDRKLAEALGAKQEAGVVVAAVRSGSPADKAGLTAGDVITEFAGESVTSPGELRQMVRKAGIDAPVEVTVQRAGETKSLSVQLIKADAGAEAPPTKTEQAAKAAQDDAPVKLGVRLTDLTPQIARQLGIEEIDKGAVVVAVQKGSPAAGAGIQPGDVILAIGDKPVETSTDLIEALKSLKGDGKTSTAVRIYRDGSYQFLPVDV